jgi:hypothetical protein
MAAEANGQIAGFEQGHSDVIEGCLLPIALLPNTPMSCADLNRASIRLQKPSFETDGLPGQARQ